MRVINHCAFGIGDVNLLIDFFFIVLPDIGIHLSVQCILNFFIKLWRRYFIFINIFSDKHGDNIGIFRKGIFYHLTDIRFDLLIEGVGHKTEPQQDNQTVEKPDADKDRHCIAALIQSFHAIAKTTMGNNWIMLSRDISEFLS